MLWPGILTYNRQYHNGKIEDVPRLCKVMQTKRNDPDHSFQEKYGSKDQIYHMWGPEKISGSQLRNKKFIIKVYFRYRFTSVINSFIKDFTLITKIWKPINTGAIITSCWARKRDYFARQAHCALMELVSISTQLSRLNRAFLIIYPSYFTATCSCVIQVTNFYPTHRLLAKTNITTVKRIFKVNWTCSLCPWCWIIITSMFRQIIAIIAVSNLELWIISNTLACHLTCNDKTIQTFCAGKLNSLRMPDVWPLFPLTVSSARAFPRKF